MNKNSNGFIENLYYPERGCIRTQSGIYINVSDPNPDHIEIEDIAYALSKIQRFGGHLKHPYSVLRHVNDCVAIASCDFKTDIFEVLMHDASEAYLGDIPSPIKSFLPDYKKMEDNLMSIIAKKYGFRYPLSIETKKIDKDQLEYEWEYYMIRGKQPPIEDTKLTISKFLSIFNKFKPNRIPSDERRVATEAK